MKTILIIGGGYSGAVVAARLLQAQHAAPLQIYLVNGSGRIARGMAYGTQSPDHTLNVPAGNMSAYDDDPEHFLRYAQQRDPQVGPGSFVPRRLYGDYLESLLQQAELAAPATTTLERLYHHVASITRRPQDQRSVVQLDNGACLSVDKVVLALGHFPANDPPLPDMAFYQTPHYIRDPWEQAKIDAIPADAPVLLLGTGLTAIDIVMTLLRRNPVRQITALSRRGLLPQHHRHTGGKAHDGTDASAIWGTAATVRQQLRGFRRYCRTLAAEGRDWREGLAILRPVTADLWQAYPQRERQRFLRHLQPYWDTHRHRLAPEVHQLFSAALQAGTVRTQAARLLQITTDTTGTQVLVRPRGSAHTLTLSCAWVINCTGPCADPRATRNGLVSQLLDDGLIRPDRLGLGIDVATDCAVVGADGSVSDTLFYIGPWLKANYWEATAVPDLRRYAHQLADHLLRA